MKYVQELLWLADYGLKINLFATMKRFAVERHQAQDGKFRRTLTKKKFLVSWPKKMYRGSPLTPSKPIGPNAKAVDKVINRAWGRQ